MSAIQCDACVDGLQADGETPCPCQSEDLPRQVRDLKREIAELRTNLSDTRDVATKYRERAEDLSRQLAERDAELARVQGEIETYRAAFDGIEPAGAALSGSGDGWRLVPIEPSDHVLREMVLAGVGAAPDPWAPAVYQAIIKHAPASPAGGTE